MNAKVSRRERHRGTASPQTIDRIQQPSEPHPRRGAGAPPPSSLFSPPSLHRVDSMLKDSRHRPSTTRAASVSPVRTGLTDPAVGNSD